MRSNQLGVCLLSYEMNRGYFADMKEFKEHGGKITDANKTVIPAVSAVKFPEFAVTLSSGKVLKLPVTSGSSEVNAESLVVPKVSLVCLSFRASSQEMISSWSKPFLESQFLILRVDKCTSCTGRGEVVCPTCNADGEPVFYKEDQMMKCSARYGRGLNALKDGSDSM
ncbi:hypothetical protein YC2023_066818 [Brassica napus]